MPEPQPTPNLSGDFSNTVKSLTTVTGFTLYLTGSITLYSQNEILPLPARRTLALLAYLCLEPGFHNREALALLLAPELMHNRAVLRNCLSELRRTFPSEWLITEGDKLAWVANESFTVDVQVFDMCLSQSHSVEPSHYLNYLESSISWIKGEFMANFFLADSDNFTSWQTAQAEGLHQKIGLALKQLSEDYFHLDQPDKAIHFAQRWLDLDSLNESAHRQLMLIYATTGDRALGIKQYHRCAELLKTQLHLAPSPETTTLYDRLKQMSFINTPKKKNLSQLVALWPLCSPEEQEILALSAVIGNSFSFDCLHFLSQYDDTRLAETLDNLQKLGFIVELMRQITTQILYDFSHPQLQTDLYSKISRTRRRLIHRRLAEWYESQPDGYTLPQRAKHYEQSGHSDLAATMWQRAGEDAFQLKLYLEAISYFEKAMQISNTKSPLLYEKIVLSQMYLGNHQEALQTCQAWRDQNLNNSSIAWILSGQIFNRQGIWLEAIQCFQKAQLTNSLSVSRQGHLYTNWCYACYQQGQLDEAFRLAQYLITIALDSSDDLLQAQGHNLLGLVVMQQGNWLQAEQHFILSQKFTHKINNPFAESSTLNNLAQLYRQSGSLAQALSVAKRALFLGIVAGDQQREAALHNNLADLLEATGEHEEALFHIRQAFILYSELGLNAETITSSVWDILVW